MKRTPAGNSTYPKGGVSYSKDNFVVNQTLVFQIKFCGKSPALLVAANRYEQWLKTGFKRKSSLKKHNFEAFRNKQWTIAFRT